MQNWETANLSTGKSSLSLTKKTILWRSNWARLIFSNPKGPVWLPSWVFRLKNLVSTVWLHTIILTTLLSETSTTTESWIRHFLASIILIFSNHQLWQSDPICLCFPKSLSLWATLLRLDSGLEWCLWFLQLNESWDLSAIWSKFLIQSQLDRHKISP